MGVIATMEKRSLQSVSSDQGWLTQLLGRLGAKSGVNVTADRALGVPAVWAAVRVVSQSIAKVPLKFYRRGPDRKGAQVARDDPRHLLVSKFPNPQLQSMEMREMMQGHLLLHGNAYALILRDRAQMPRELWPLPPYRVRVTRAPGSRERVYWVLDIDGTPGRVSPEDMLHIRGFMTDGLVGIDVVWQMREALGLSIAADEMAAAFFGGGATPGGILTWPHAGKPEKRAQFLEQWERRHSGSGNAGRVALLEDGITYQQVTTDPNKAQLLESRQWGPKDIARIFGVPPYKIGDLDQGIRANVEQQELSFIADAIDSWAVRWEQSLDWSLLMPRERERDELFFRHQLNALIRPDTAARGAYYESQFRVGAITPDEIRELEERLPYDDGSGDTAFVQLNLVPLPDAGRALAPVPGGDGGDGNGRALPPVPQRRQLPEPQTGDRRGADLRRRIQNAHVPAFRDAFERIIRREVDRVTAILDKNTDQGFKTERLLRSSFIEQLGAFFGPEDQTWIRWYQPTLGGLAESIAAMAAEEVGQGDEDTAAAVDTYVDGHVGVTARREVSSSRNQIEQLADELPTEEAPAAIRERLGGWLESRASELATREVVDAGAGVAKAVFASVGITRLMWSANVGACPLCQEMDGRIVGINRSFLNVGDTVDPGGDTSPLVAQGNITTPGLHRGCSCQILPVFG